MSILVSINCITYNHEDYISDAIEGFLMQKIDFDFEILIGEDCSTDGTKQIVEEYVGRYPEKIRLITSSKNVGGRKNAQRLRDNSQGKYIALCEGDDYWTDPYKLQKQVDYLESHPNCTMCFHGAEIVKANKKQTGSFIKPWEENKECSPGDLILNRGFFPTASIVFQRHLMANPPNWYMVAPIGDIPLVLILSSQGYAYYMDEVMSAYRAGVKGSWTSKNLSCTNFKQKRIKVYKDQIFILDKFNEYTCYKYSNEVDKIKLINEFEILVLEKRMKEIKCTRYKQYYESLGFIGRMKLYLRYYFPKSYRKSAHIKEYIKEIKNRIKAKAKNKGRVRTYLRRYSLVRKIALKIMAKVFKIRGYSDYFASTAAEKFIEDLFKNKEVCFKQKKWAYKRGFFSYSIRNYGLNDENYTNYLPDFYYYKLYPINGEFSKWIDDKLTLKYILYPFSQYLPKYYFHLYNGKVFKLMDCPDEYNADNSGIISLLKEQKNFAIKLLDGTCGRGFYKLTYDKDEFLVNNKYASANEVNKLLSSLDNYLITEYIIAHNNIRKIYDAAPNTLRVMVVYDDKDGPQVTGALIKFGTARTGVVDIASLGGVFCTINIQDGIYNCPKVYKGFNIIDVSGHPDTGEKLEDVIPNWELIKKKLVEIGRYIPQVRYIGFDIIITNDGFKIIEINSHQSVDFIQAHNPIFINKYNRMFFNKLFTSQPRKFRKMLMQK